MVFVKVAWFVFVGRQGLDEKEPDSQSWVKAGGTSLDIAVTGQRRMGQ